MPARSSAGGSEVLSSYKHVTMNAMTNQIFSLGTPINENTPIFRVFSRKWLLEMFRSKQLALRPPHKWDDPFENFLLKCNVTILGHQNQSLAGVIKNYYGQCWSLNHETDATWRIYSPNKDGVRVSTTVGRMLRSIYNPNDPFRLQSYHIGSVAYIEEAELKRLFEEPGYTAGLVLDPNGIGQSRHLFLKRKEFEHENEVRLLYQYNNASNSDQRSEEYWNVSIEPNALFDDILIDPRMDDHDSSLLEKDLRGLGYTKQIQRSSLYQLPNLNIKIELPS